MTPKKTSSIISGRNINTSSSSSDRNTSVPSSSDINTPVSERSNQTNIQTSQSSSPQYLFYYDSANIATITKDDSYVSFLFLGEEFSPVTSLQDQLVNEMISKLKKTNN
ncbi:3125_t:CDS:1 [Cetraspora pellucida]|uniref:3125_t:CDS:1 n=1 Tax=Cetraspora pellucida TaxID=1433469 RepID=A0A9N9G6C1_9GLOM|nr:3125_t:CDS:1 [Cetraspora pellucida]